MKNELSDEMRRFRIVLAPLLAAACILVLAAPARAGPRPSSFDCAAVITVRSAWSFMFVVRGEIQ
jgi:hypothetical protein